MKKNNKEKPQWTSLYYFSYLKTNSVEYIAITSKKVFFTFLNNGIRG